jgi:hypothetical protein
MKSPKHGYKLHKTVTFPAELHLVVNKHSFFHGHFEIRMINPEISLAQSKLTMMTLKLSSWLCSRLSKSADSFLENFLLRYRSFGLELQVTV